MTFTLAVLVFTGTASVAALALATVWRTLRERAEAERTSDAAASLRRFVAPERLTAVRFCVCVLCAAAAALALIANGVPSPFAWLPAALATGAAGWKAPALWYAFKIHRRKEAFDAQILNLTMTLANGLRSGQALPQALDAAAQRIPAPMQEELALVLNETRLGLELPEALERLHARMPGEDLRLLVTSVRLTLQAGGSLADVLERMVVMIRSRTEFQEKVKTMTAQGRFEAIAMSLAPVAVYVLLRLIDPELMKPLTATTVGWCAIGGVAVLLSVGFFIINKIVTIEV